MCPFRKKNLYAMNENFIKYVVLEKSDFLPDVFTCDENSFRCLYNPQFCIPEKWVCDGTADCHDGSDEILCKITTPIRTTSITSTISTIAK